jgi:hypothetical protein
LAFNGSGVFVRVHDWTTDLGNAVPVTASRADAEDDGFATGLSNTICRDGQSTTTARIPFAAGTSSIAGTTASVSYAQTNDNNTGLYFPASDEWGLVAGGTAVLTGTATGVAVTGTFSSSGAVTLSSTLALTGNLAINTDKFTVTAASGNTAVGGTLAVTGAATLSSTLAAGNTTVTGTLAASGNVAINTDKFTVAAASGNTVIAGTAAIAGNVAVNTDKFTVAAASGNTLVAGTLAVTGASTLTGALTANNAAGVTAKNSCKAAVYFTTNGSGTVTIVNQFNVASVSAATVETFNGFQLAFTNALPSGNFIVKSNVRIAGSSTGVLIYHSTRATTTFDFMVHQIGGSATRASLIVDMEFIDPT